MNLKKLLSAFYFIMVFSVVSAPGQVMIDSMSPADGPVGTQVTLTGSGFPESDPLTVNVGGANATILERTTNLIRFTVPTAALTGPVLILTGGDEYFAPFEFSVTRLLTAQIAPETQINVSSYTVGT